MTHILPSVCIELSKELLDNVMPFHEGLHYFKAKVFSVREAWKLLYDIGAGPSLYAIVHQIENRSYYGLKSYDTISTEFFHVGDEDKKLRRSLGVYLHGLDSLQLFVNRETMSFGRWHGMMQGYNIHQIMNLWNMPVTPIEAERDFYDT